MSAKDYTPSADNARVPLPERLLVDALGYVWQDGAAPGFLSMARTTDRNLPSPGLEEYRPVGAQASQPLTEPSVAEWAARAHAARERAIAKGYTPEHDAEHGVRHLLNWAIDYARRGRAEDASGLILSAIALLDAPQPVTEEQEAAAAQALYERHVADMPDAARAQMPAWDPDSPGAVDYRRDARAALEAAREAGR